MRHSTGHRMDLFPVVATDHARYLIAEVKLVRFMFYVADGVYDTRKPSCWAHIYLSILIL